MANKTAPISHSSNDMHVGAGLLSWSEPALTEFVPCLKTKSCGVQKMPGNACIHWNASRNKCIIQRDICAKASCVLVTSSRSACMSTPSAGATEATALATSSWPWVLPPTRGKVCFLKLIATRCFEKDALKPYAARDGMAI